MDKKFQKNAVPIIREVLGVKRIPKNIVLSNGQLETVCEKLSGILTKVELESCISTHNNSAASGSAASGNKRKRIQKVVSDSDDSSDDDDDDDDDAPPKSQPAPKVAKKAKQEAKAKTKSKQLVKEEDSSSDDDDDDEPEPAEPKVKVVERKPETKSKTKATAAKQVPVEESSDEDEEEEEEDDEDEDDDSSEDEEEEEEEEQDDIEKIKANSGVAFNGESETEPSSESEGEGDDLDGVQRNKKKKKISASASASAAFIDSDDDVESGDEIPVIPIAPDITGCSDILAGNFVTEEDEFAVQFSDVSVLKLLVSFVARNAGSSKSSVLALCLNWPLDGKSITTMDIRAQDNIIAATTIQVKAVIDEVGVASNESYYHSPTLHKIPVLASAQIFSKHIATLSNMSQVVLRYKKSGKLSLSSKGQETFSSEVLIPTCDLKDDMRSLIMANLLMHDPKPKEEQMDGLAYADFIIHANENTIRIAEEASSAKVDRVIVRIAERPAKRTPSTEIPAIRMTRFGFCSDDEEKYISSLALANPTEEGGVDVTGTLASLNASIQGFSVKDLDRAFKYNVQEFAISAHMRTILALKAQSVSMMVAPSMVVLRVEFPNSADSKENIAVAQLILHKIVVEEDE